VVDVIQAYPNNSDVKQLIDSFVNSPESRGLYTGNNAAYVNAVYLNVFNRNSEAGGLGFWTGFLGRQELSRAQVAMWVLNGAQNADAAVVAKKVEAATYFTNALGKGAAYIIGYSGDNISEAARALLASITATTDMTAFKVEIDAFLESMIGAPGPGVAVVRYSGFNYLQDMEAGPAYSAKYTLAGSGQVGTRVNVPVVGVTSGSVTYGELPVTVNWTFDPVSGAFSYAAPITGNSNLVQPGVVPNGVLKLPQVAMLCSSVSGSVKSTDVLISNNNVAVVDAHELANQSLTVYREDCATASGAGNTKSFSFDAGGGGVITSQTGTSTYSASAVNQILGGQLLYDAVAKKFWTFKAYKFLTEDGSYSFVIVQHQGDSATSLKSGSLGLWSQQ
jgi:hypothetical protein